MIGAGDIKRISFWIVSCRGFYYESPFCAECYNVFLVRWPTGWLPFANKLLWVAHPPIQRKT